MSVVSLLQFKIINSNEASQEELINYFIVSVVPVQFVADNILASCQGAAPCEQHGCFIDIFRFQIVRLARHCEIKKI